MTLAIAALAAGAAQAATAAGTAAASCTPRTVLAGPIRTVTFCGPASVTLVDGGATTRIVGGTCRWSGDELTLQVGRGVQGARTGRYARLDIYRARHSPPGKVVVALQLDGRNDVGLRMRARVGPSGAQGVFSGTWLRTKTSFTGTFQCGQ